MYLRWQRSTFIVDLLGVRSAIDVTPLAYGRRMADDLLESLRTLTGRADAEFHPDQREAIEALVNGRDRVLLVQRTG